MKCFLFPRIFSLFLCAVAVSLLSSSSSAADGDSGSLYLSVESLSSMLKRKQDIVLVDVRGEEAFQKFWIPGSLRIPLYAIKTKDFLKDKPFVLIAEGYPDSSLEQGCRSLREAGFKRAFILSGGLNSWKEKKGPLEGDVFSRQEVNKVLPAAFYKEKDSMHWFVVDVSKAGAEPVIPRAVRVPYAGNREAFLSGLKAAMERNPGPTSRSLLLCDDKGETYGALEPLIRKGKIKRVFYLQGGIEGYGLFLNHLEASRHSTTVGITKCVSCP